MKAARGTIRARAVSCEGKKRFVSFGKAATAAHTFASFKKARFTAYHCRHCGGFHVGTQLSPKAQHHQNGFDDRQRYAVFAREGTGGEQLVGWSSLPDGGRVAEMVRDEPGWAFSRVTERRRRAA